MSTSARAAAAQVPTAVTSADSLKRLSAGRATATGMTMRSRDLFSPGLASALRSAATTFLLQGIKDNESVAAQVSVARWDIAWTGTLEAKPDEEASNTVLTDATALRSGTTGGLAVSGVIWFHQSSVPDRPPGDLAVAWCLDHQASRGPISGDYDCHTPRLATLPAALRNEFDQLAAFTGRPLLWALEVKVGPQDFAYIDLPATHDTSEVWQGSVRTSVGGWTPLGLLTGGLAWKRSYKAGDEADLCTPIEGSAALRCEKGVFGAPTRKQGVAAALELRRFLGPAFAVNPRVSFGGANRVFTAQLPIYVLPNDKHALIGGVLPSWTTEHHNVTIGVFVGTAFDLSVAKP